MLEQLMSAVFRTCAVIGTGFRVGASARVCAGAGAAGRLACASRRPPSPGITFFFVRMWQMCCGSPSALLQRVTLRPHRVRLAWMQALSELCVRRGSAGVPTCLMQTSNELPQQPGAAGAAGGEARRGADGAAGEQPSLGANMSFNSTLMAAHMGHVPSADAPLTLDSQVGPCHLACLSTDPPHWAPFICASAAAYPVLAAVLRLMRLSWMRGSCSAGLAALATARNERSRAHLLARPAPVTGQRCCSDSQQLAEVGHTAGACRWSSWMHRSGAFVASCPAPGSLHLHSSRTLDAWQSAFLGASCCQPGCF